MPVKLPRNAPAEVFSWSIFNALTLNVLYQRLQLTCGLITSLCSTLILVLLDHELYVVYI